jgi:hypothetical protein
LTRVAEDAPGGTDWLHEIKYDGYHMHARIDGAKIQLLTRTGLDWSSPILPDDRSNSGGRLMATPWEDQIKNRNPKQLTIFVAPTLNKPWRRAFDDALTTFNQLSQDNRLGVTMVVPENVTKPDPNGEGGADVQFDMGKGDITFSALGQDFQLKNFSGTAMHGKTELLRGQVGNQGQRIRKAFVFVP